MNRYPLYLLLILISTHQLMAQVISIGDIDGSNGAIFTNDLNDITTGVFAQSGTIGDINNDGIDDYAHSVFVIDGINSNALQIVIVFGSMEGFELPFNFSEINGSNGFRITDNNRLLNVWNTIGEAGDLNGDGIDDMVITHVQSNPDNERVAAVIYGQNNFSDTFDLANINGNNGFIITDSSNLDSPSNRFFVSKDVLDLNCDGFNDLTIGAPFAGNNNTPGTVFVLYGNGNFSGTEFSLDTVNGSNGINIIAPNTAVDFGFALSGIGDFNGDNCDDLAIGDLNAPSSDGSAIGKVHIVFGANNLVHPFNTVNLNGTNGFTATTANAPNATNGLGTSVSGGDFNGDGLSDLIIGASGGTGDQDATILAAHAIVIEGSSSNIAEMTVSYQGGNRVSALRGFAGHDGSNPGLVGVNVTSADVNGDNRIDVLIDASGATINSTDLPGAGLINVVYGQQGGHGAQLILSDIESNTDLGFIIAGNNVNDSLGTSINVLDINADGIDDIGLAGDEGTAFPLGSNTGAFFMLYGIEGDPIFANGFE